MLDVEKPIKGCKTAIRSEKIIKDILDHLAPLNRNLVSDEFEESLCYLRKYIDLKMHCYKTGSQCWTWDIPPKWRIKNGYIRKDGKEIASIKQHPLQVMSYSTPVHEKMKGSELLKHIYEHPILADAIPYEFSFYKRRWGFCLTRAQRNLIQEEEMYDVCIDSEFIDDYLSVGEYTVPGTSDEHIFFLCHIDHPCQVNDSLTGVAVNVALAKRLESKKGYYNYTFLFVPETIGSIAYLSHNENLISKIRYAIFDEMIGLEKPLILQKSYREDALINAYALYVIKKRQGESRGYPFLSVASNDEKVFDGPGIGVPSISITRVDQERRLQKNQEYKSQGKHAVEPPYPEYHSHLDNLKLISYQNVNATVDCLFDLVNVLESDFIPIRKFKGPVFLSKFDLWIDWRTDWEMNEKMIWLMYSLEGEMTAFQIAEKLNIDFEKVVAILSRFYEKGLIEKRQIEIGFDR